jgi:hypothetical protein
MSRVLSDPTTSTCSIFFQGSQTIRLTFNLLRGLEQDCIRVVKETISILGGLDIIISNAVRDPRPDFYLQAKT